MKATPPIGTSIVKPSSGDTPPLAVSAFKRGSYGNLNVLYYPWKNVLTGLEFVWGELEQKDGQSATDYRLQFSTKVAF